MAVSKKAITKKHLIWKYIFAIVLILLGGILELFSLGKSFGGFESIGLWLIYVGILMGIFAAVSYKSKKNKIVDERMEKIGYHATRITFLILFLALFLILILDKIITITIAYSEFVSWIIMGTLIVYVIVYKILERNN
ncbi:hypothetical protein HOD88_01195 [archaeon]|jgi:uncharacterized membrane protein|nr:hypothetical protein [archaeon]